jgi:PAT family beta-lactamase induction signal transducer AmpG
LWLFSVLGFPIGFTNGVTTLLMPYLLRNAGVAVNQIAEISVIASLPFIWYFVWAPVVDTGLRRRTWLMLSALACGLAAGASVLSIRGPLPVLTALLFAMNAFSGLIQAANGPLLASVSEAARGKTGGSYNMGLWGAGSVGGGAAIWVANHAALAPLAGVVAAATIWPSLAALFVEETAAVQGTLGVQMTELLQKLRGVFGSCRTWLGLAFFLSPVGSAAVGSLISGLGPDYHASGTEVALISGIGGGLLNMAGSFLGGIVANRMSRMVAYSLSGFIAAASAIYLAVGPATPITYGVGYGGYAVAAGFAWAVYTALVLDVIGLRYASGAAWAVLNAAGNIPIAYMTWLDGAGYRRWGARGFMSVDAVANGVFAAILLVVAVAVRKRWRAHQ